MQVVVQPHVSSSHTSEVGANVHSPRTSLLGLAATLALATSLGAACGAAPTTGAQSGGSSAANPAKTATSIADLGGLDKLVAAAKKEGRLNVIALPPDWANYGEIIKAFGTKYGIKVNSENPDGSSSDEINAVKTRKGQDRAPDVARPRHLLRAQRRAGGPVRPVQGARPGTRSPKGRRTRTAPGTTTTAATSRSAATPSSVKNCPQTLHRPAQARRTRARSR